MLERALRDWISLDSEKLGNRVADCTYGRSADARAPGQFHEGSGRSDMSPEPVTRNPIHPVQALFLSM